MREIAYSRNAQDCEDLPFLARLLTNRLSSMHRIISIGVILSLLSGCSNPSEPQTDIEVRSVDPPSVVASDATADDETPSDDETSIEIRPVASGPLSEETIKLLDKICDPGDIGSSLRKTLNGLVETGDQRIAWVILDRLRLENGYPSSKLFVQAFSKLMQVNIRDNRSSWRLATNLMIARNIPAPPDYPRWKWASLKTIDERWKPFFEDPDSTIDWRLVSWGGVLIDDRPVKETGLPGYRCIPALTDPATTKAAAGSWYPDDRTIFGVEIDGESRAYPKNVMEVHEMVNDELGGRRFALPYCTLCGAAQLYFTDKIPDAVTDQVKIPLGRFEMRTSGLLKRSNKVMYELQTYSLFDTFTGAAVSGPLRKAGVTLPAGTVVTTTWGDWKRTHPKTTILAERSPWNREYRDDPLGGRDDKGPIFPIGDHDKRLPIQEPVLGVITSDGTQIAFPVAEVNRHLENNDSVEFNGVRVIRSANGLRSENIDGSELPSHQAFWFAWSQFHPTTRLWSVEQPPAEGNSADE